ncbi:MAG: inositol monophosphatase [Nanoarchaeota archaeon]|nr:inositol monophosphatase [Nanoarchaeota archaeon]MBU1005203.1 inositol monophosphatase [Nanoarchaeota archaeon]MBU1946874.1 inositol monophosphatase [Nanoarchaeota archaeon]
MTFRQIALKAAKAAARIQLRYFCKDIKKKEKADNSYVTKADIESTKKIRSIILKEFPNHDIICEEMGSSNKHSDYRWIIDPLDGTHNFIMDNPLFGSSIALQYQKEIILGVVYMPALKRLYYAEKGKGFFCNGKKLRVNNETDLKKCLLIFDAKLREDTDMKINILKKLAKSTWRTRSYGVAVYNNILIAEGKAGINIDFKSNIWDHSAVLLMVEEAGGKVTDLNGKRWTPEIKDYIATNGKIHNKILSVLK